MIAAVASIRGLPLHTRDADDFNGLGSALEIVEV
jgi:predicted nucleic acid-binding protein